MDSSSEAEGIEVMRHMMAPSFRLGMNSLPRNGNSARLPIKAPAAMPSTSLRRANAQASTVA